MIRIEKIYPFGENTITSLKGLETEFFQAINKGTNPFDRLVVGYTAGELGNTTLSFQQKEFLNLLLVDYDRLILSTPKVLSEIIRKYKPYQSLLYNETNKKTTVFGKDVLNAFDYKRGFRSIKNKGVWLAKKLNIKSCPYCNCQYTLYVKYADNSGLAKFQFDHFFSKDRYPYLSLSLYNLIPSCASCNHKKNNEPMSLKKHYHPYINSINDRAKFKVRYPTDIKKLNVSGILRMNEDDISIEFVPKRKAYKRFVGEHDRIFDITPIYERHKDIAHEILMRSVLNTKYYQKGTVSIEGLFPDKTTLLKYILGNYMKESEINKRPLAKLYQDIAKQLKLI